MAIALRTGLFERDTTQADILGKTEQTIYDFIISSGTTPVTPFEIYRDLFNTELAYEPRLVRTNISNLRSKLGATSVLTLDGIGYVGGEVLSDIVVDPSWEPLDRELPGMRIRPDQLSPICSDVYRLLFYSGRTMSLPEIWEHIYGEDKPSRYQRVEQKIPFIRRDLGQYAVISAKNVGLFVPSERFVRTLYEKFSL
jgi:DNA-binding response OmpR family regulator